MHDNIETDNVPEVFYMVYVENATSPTRKYFDITSATKEATKLAREYPRKRVFIMKSLSFIETESPLPVKHTYLERDV